MTSTKWVTFSGDSGVACSARCFEVFILNDFVCFTTWRFSILLSRFRGSRLWRRLENRYLRRLREDFITHTGGHFFVWKGNRCQHNVNKDIHREIERDREWTAEGKTDKRPASDRQTDRHEGTLITTCGGRRSSAAAADVGFSPETSITHSLGYLPKGKVIRGNNDDTVVPFNGIRWPEYRNGHGGRGKTFQTVSGANGKPITAAWLFFSKGREKERVGKS